jgi:hypothetical protein
MIINAAVGGGLAGVPDAATLPQEMRVDYVRWYVVSNNCLHCALCVVLLLLVNYVALCLTVCFAAAVVDALWSAVCAALQST